MGIDADRVSRQAEQLRSTGMLIIPESPLRLWGSLLGCVGFTVVGVLRAGGRSRRYTSTAGDRLHPNAAGTADASPGLDHRPAEPADQ